MKIKELEKKLLKSSVALGLALSLSACSTAPLRSPYSLNMTDSERIIAIDTYQKNMLRNYGESVDNALSGEELDFKGKLGVVHQMQNERIKDYAINAGMAILNTAGTIYLINILDSSGSTSSKKTPTIGTGSGQTNTGNMIGGDSTGSGTTIIGFGN